MKSINIAGVLFVATILLWSTGCRKFNALEGNGFIESELRMSVSFNKVVNNDNFNVYCVYDTVFKVVIEAESNLIPHIRTVVAGNTLHIDTYENLDNNYVMKVTVYSPVLLGVELAGSGLFDIAPRVSESFEAKINGSGNIYGSITAGNFEAITDGSGDMNIDIVSANARAIIRGSGNIILSGTAAISYLEIYGSGYIDAYGLPVGTCNAKIAGSGNIYTTVNNLLDAKIYGSGNIYYLGNPVINTDISGSGNIIGG